MKNFCMFNQSQIMFEIFFNLIIIKLNKMTIHKNFLSIDSVKTFHTIN